MKSSSSACADSDEWENLRTRQNHGHQIAVYISAVANGGQESKSEVRSRFGFYVLLVLHPGSKKGRTCLVKKSDKCAESWPDYRRRRRMPFSIQPPAGHSLLSPAVIGALGSAA